MRNQVEVKSELLVWARERSGRSSDWLGKRFPYLDAWIAGQTKPTLKQLESFAKAMYAPVGCFFLPKPPVERVPIPDFRTMRNQDVARPSPDLLDTLYICQQRQEWYRDFARSMGESPRAFVGSAQVKSNVEKTAATIRHSLGFDLDERKQVPTWTDALRLFIEQADVLGVLVMVNGVVGSNNKRKLDPHEFRGFALADDLAPLVFINGADSKSAQMFTLAHELAHLWLGESAVSDVDPVVVSSNAVEGWCNKVAAELLVPLAAIRDEFQSDEPLRDEMIRLARRFKVSTLVVLRRIHDLGKLTQKEFWAAYEAELVFLMQRRGGGGGDFYLTQAARVGKRFARALVISTLEGQTLHRDAFRLLGFSKFETFQKLGQSLGVV